MSDDLDYVVPMTEESWNKLTGIMAKLLDIKQELIDFQSERLNAVMAENAYLKTELDQAYNDMDSNAEELDYLLKWMRDNMSYMACLPTNDTGEVQGPMVRRFYHDSTNMNYESFPDLLMGVLDKRDEDISNAEAKVNEEIDTNKWPQECWEEPKDSEVYGDCPFCSDCQGQTTDPDVYQ